MHEARLISAASDRSLGLQRGSSQGAGHRRVPLASRRCLRPPDGASFRHVPRTHSPGALYSVLNRGRFVDAVW